MEVQKIPFTAEVGSFIAAHHYTRTFPWSVQHCFGLFEEGVLRGVCTVGHFSRQQSAQKYARDLELNRFVLVDGLPKNTASFFLGKCLQWMRTNTELFGIVSYADPTVGHQGIIYQATNFTRLGSTSPSYHYVNPTGKRVHKKKIWKEARARQLTERAWAETLGLTRMQELPKIIYRYALRRGKVEVFGEIYRISNTLNTKVYVGKTTQSIQRRYKRHQQDAQDGSHLPIHCAMRGLGLAHFRVEKIDEAHDAESLQQKEAHWIAQHQSTDRQFGYNVDAGYSHESYLIPDAVFIQSLLWRQQGEPLTEIAERLCVSYDYLVSVQGGRIRPHLLQEFEIQHGPLSRPKKLSVEEKLQIFDLFYAGKKISEVARLTAATTTYVRMLLNGKIDSALRASYIKQHGKMRRTSNLKTREMVFAIFSDYFSKQLRVEEIQKAYRLQDVHGFIVKHRKGLLVEWEKQHGKAVRDPHKVPQEVLLEVFRLKQTGAPTQRLAEQFGLALNWLNQVLRGDERPEVLAAWSSSGGAPAKKARPLRPACRVESDTLCFQTPKDAADFLGVTSAAILKAIRKGSKCKGHRFWYVTPSRSRTTRGP